MILRQKKKLLNKKIEKKNLWGGGICPPYSGMGGGLLAPLEPTWFCIEDPSRNRLASTTYFAKPGSLLCKICRIIRIKIIIYILTKVHFLQEIFSRNPLKTWKYSGIYIWIKKNVKNILIKYINIKQNCVKLWKM